MSISTTSRLGSGLDETTPAEVEEEGADEDVARRTLRDHLKKAPKIWRREADPHLQIQPPKTPRRARLQKTKRAG